MKEKYLKSVTKKKKFKFKQKINFEHKLNSNEMTIRRKTKQQEKNIHKILSTRDGKTMKKQNGKNFCLNIFFKSQSSFHSTYKTLSIHLQFFFRLT